MICPHIKTTPEVVDYINKFNTDEELLRSGGLPTNILDRLAFGFSDEDIKTLNPDQLHVKWHDDMDNVKWEQQKSGLSKLAWAKTINLSEPIDVVFEKNKFYIDDGHHRTYAAKILKQPLNVNLDIRMNPIITLAPKLGYDDFHRCLFKQIKNMNLNEQLSRIKNMMGLTENIQIKPISFDNPYDDEDEDFDVYDASDQADKIAKIGGINILRGKELSYVATIQNQVVGALWIETSNNEFSFDVAVDPNFQGKGIGEKLVKIAISEFDNYNIDGDLTYKIDVTNPIMEKLLTKFGFHIINKIPGHTIMTK